MSVLNRHPWANHPRARWAVPAAIAVIAVGGGSAAGLLPASAQDQLPSRSAAQLLVDLQGANPAGLSGTVVQRADLGLPQLPVPGGQGGGQGSSDLTSLISGSHTLRLWYGGPTRERVALLGTLGESDVIRNGADLWTWSSSSNSASHRKLTGGPSDRAGGPSDQAGGPSGQAGGPSDQAGGPSPSGLPLTPQQAADRALAAIDPSTEVTTAGTATVAGHAAYELVLTPRDAGSLVGQLRIALDAAHHVPLRVQVFARGATRAAAEVAFTQVSFEAQPDSQFRFLPPPGATVTEQSGQPQSGRQQGQPPAAGPAKPSSAGSGRPVVLGSGWTSVLAARLPAGALGGSDPSGDRAGRDTGAGTSLASIGRVLQALPRVSGAWGSGRLLRSDLFSVLLTDDGRIYAGAVAPDRLYQAAAQPLPAASAAGAATAP